MQGIFVFDKELRDRAIKYFEWRLGKSITAEEAEAWLDSLAELFISLSRTAEEPSP